MSYAKEEKDFDAFKDLCEKLEETYGFRQLIDQSYAAHAEDESEELLQHCEELEALIGKVTLAAGQLSPRKRATLDDITREAGGGEGELEQVESDEPARRKADPQGAAEPAGGAAGGE